MNDQIPIRHSKRAKRMSLVVHFDGRWEVVVPEKRKPSSYSIQRFVSTHWDWLEQQVRRMSRRVPRKTLTHRGVPTWKIKEATADLVELHVRRFLFLYPFEIGQIRYGNYKTQWGSCSNDRHLGFHYKLSLLPPHLAAYIVAHELSHTVHFNHSDVFWQMVERLCPEAKQYRKELRDYVL